MKLYLSSYRVPVVEALFGLLPSAPGNIRMGLIPNAGDYYAERARNFKIQEKATYFRQLRFNPEIIDLRQHQPATLKETLSNYDFIWVSGGNTFNLRYEMRRSGFDKLIGTFLENGMVYGGDSAGAVVAGPTLEGVELADEPEFAEEHITVGLGLVPHIVVPHVGSLQYGEAMEQMQSMHQANPHVVPLTDSQVFVIDGAESQVLTAPQED